jgi:Domain of unknown function (DUF4160)
MTSDAPKCRSFIRMFVEPGERHRMPHFHDYYQDHVAVFTISPVELIAGANCLSVSAVW